MALNLINQLMKKGSSGCTGKFSVFSLLHQASLASRINAHESFRSGLLPPLCSYHSNPSHPQQARSFQNSYCENSNARKNERRITPRLPPPRDSTPIGRRFENWVESLKPGFQPEDVVHVLQEQTDPDLALDIFQWTAQQRTYKHNHQTYELMIQILSSGKRYKQMERLMEDVMAGACICSESLFNTMIYNYCDLRMTGPAINVYKKMQKDPNCKPTVKTYNLLLNALVGRFSSLTVCFVYLRSVRSLYKQMKAAGVAPNIITLNLLIKAYSRALEMEEAVRLFREMGLYGCSPNPFTFNYIIRGLCEKGKMKEALEFYDDMLRKGLFPNKRVYNVLVSSLSLEGRLQDASKALVDMTDNGMVPDYITYRTVMDMHCKKGRQREASKLLRDLRDKGHCLDELTYRRLVNGFNLIG